MCKDLSARGMNLVIIVIRGSKEMAKIFYPGSAHSICALEKAKAFLDALGYDEGMDDAAVQLQLIRACEACGGGLDRMDAAYARKKYPGEAFKDRGYRREDGLIGISSYCMEVMEDLAGGMLMIDLDYMTVSSAVWWRPSGLPGGGMEREDGIRDACEAPFQLASIRKENLDEAICFLKLTNKQLYRYGGCTWGII